MNILARMNMSIGATLGLLYLIANRIWPSSLAAARRRPNSLESVLSMWWIPSFILGWGASLGLGTLGMLEMPILLSAERR